MGFLQGKVGSDGHYYEARRHDNNETYVVRDGHEIVSGLTKDPGYTGHFMDSLGGHNVPNPHETSGGGSIFDSLSSLGGGRKEPTKKGWFDL